MHIFGPVPSRRLGISLGIDPIPLKICTYNCIYCEVGKTTDLTIKRKNYVSVSVIKKELLEYKNTHKDVPIDYITLSGSGEPTLNSEIEGIIHTIKEIFPNVPVAILTNGSLLYIPEVRKSLFSADVVLPSLDAATNKIFKRINQPHPELDIKIITEGIIKFREEYTGKIWLEVLFAKGVNDKWSEVESLKTAIDHINPDKVQLNTVDRPPAFSLANPVDENFLKKVKEYFGERAEIITDFKSKRGFSEDIGETILKALSIRPMTLDQLEDSVNLHRDEILKYFGIFEKENKIKEVIFSGKKYFQGV